MGMRRTLNWAVKLGLLLLCVALLSACQSDDASELPDVEQRDSGPQADTSGSDTDGLKDAAKPDATDERDTNTPPDERDAAGHDTREPADAQQPPDRPDTRGPDATSQDTREEDAPDIEEPGGEDTTSPPSWSTDPGRSLVEPLYGVTSEGVAQLSQLDEALSRHSRRPTTRVVFQQGTTPSNYAQTVSTLRETGYVMGEILDSTALGAMSTRRYAQRTRDFVERFGDQVDIWEIGNELNGEWAGTPSDLNQKVLAAWEVVHQEYAHLNLRSAVTLNYWPSHNCYAEPWEATIDFAQNMPEEVREGSDFLFLSFYETACNPRATPSVEEVAAVFETLMTLFPNSKVGFGEVGAQGTSDGFPDPSLEEKQQIARRYYGMHGQLRDRLGSRYVGGYFWWYYDQDAVPWDRRGSLWDTLDELFQAY